MKTKIFHPNIHSSGEVCVSTLKKDWSPKYGIEHILLVIKCLLITPNPDSALDAEAGRLLQDVSDTTEFFPFLFTYSLNFPSKCRPTRNMHLQHPSGQEFMLAIALLAFPYQNQAAHVRTRRRKSNLWR